MVGSGDSGNGSFHNSDVTFLIYEGNSWLQELKYCGDYWYDVIFRDHILLNFCTCDNGWQLLGNYPVLTVVTEIYHYVEIAGELLLPLILI